MPTLIGDPYLPTWRGKYPHMLAEDVPIWNTFLDRYQSLFQRLFYDVRVGGIWSTDSSLSYKMQEMYFNVTAKRLDVVADLENEVWLIEVAHQPGLRVVGQLMSYVALWYDNPGLSKPAVGVLVARSIDSDLQRALKIYGLRVRLIG